jgi:hypothetical protein
MVERPILFSAPMVCAILAGTKTQTRRVVKPMKDRDVGCMLSPCELAGEINQGKFRNSIHGEPGDHLWVRESFSRLEAFDFFSPEVPDPVPEFWYWADGNPTWGDWTRPKPSIHMPRAACRIVLEITGVRVERLQEISEADAKAEGIEPFTDFQPTGHWRRYRDSGVTSYVDNPIASYASLWTEINGPGSWEANPWVWVVEFRRVEA